MVSRPTIDPRRPIPTPCPVPWCVLDEGHAGDCTPDEVPAPTWDAAPKQEDDQ